MTDFDAATRAFWSGRDLQAQRQLERGKADAGTRGAVTGGQHLSPMQEAIARLFDDPDLPDLSVRARGKITLPGYYRRSKDWDLVVTYRDVLVAAIEFKSQVGSFGNNFNNRVEESIGNAVDVWKAYEEGVFGPVRPWLGFVMLVEHTDKSIKKLTRDPATVYPPDKVFTDTSYIDRYGILFQRLVRERLYDAAALVPTERDSGPIVDPSKPELSLQYFAAGIAGRLAFIKSLNL